LNESTRRLKLLSKKLGGCIERARPYYDALEVAKKAQLECQRAAVQFQRANGMWSPNCVLWIWLLQIKTKLRKDSTLFPQEDSCIYNLNIYQMWWGRTTK